MSNYTLRIVWLGFDDVDGKKVIGRHEEEFLCTVNGGALHIPPNALRLLHRKHPEAISVKSVQWVGDRPDIYRCGALSEEEAQELCDAAQLQGDIGMQLMGKTEPETKLTLKDLARQTAPERIIRLPNLGN